MPDRLELPWIDALAGRTGAADAARVAESLAHDPAAAEAFEGWRRLASAVRDDAAARAGGLPPLDGVLAAIRTPAAHGDGPTPLDRIGRATLRRLAAEPIDVAGAPSPVPAWVIGAAAVAAMVVFALWPTPHGPLGGVFFAALRQQNAQPPIAAAIGPTPVARLRDAAADLRRDRQGVDTGALRANAGDRPGALAALELDGADYDVPLDAVLRWPDGVRGGPGGAAGAAAARTATPRPGTARAAGAVTGPGQVAPPGGDPNGYPAPQSPSVAYPPPSPRRPAETGGEGRKPSKPPAKPPATQPPEPTLPPPTATPAATPAASTVVGHVVGDDGGGRAQVRVAAYRRDDGPIGGSWIETFTADASGRYTLTLAPGTWQLYAEAPGHRPQWWQNADRPEGGQGVELAIGQTTGADWRLAASGDGDGLLVGEASAHAWVRAVPEGTDPATAAGPSALADGSGHFALPLPAGRWAVARADDGRDRDWRALAEVVEIVAGVSTTVSWP
jgi:hypothetical protein